MFGFGRRVRPRRRLGLSGRRRVLACELCPFCGRVMKKEDFKDWGNLVKEQDFLREQVFICKACRFKKRVFLAGGKFFKYI